MNVTRILPLVFLFLLSCKTDSGKSGEKSLQEIRTEEEDISSIIRNPVSARGVDTVNVARIEFGEEVYDFGTAREGDQVSHTYVFRNTGKVPLMITHAKSTCGCTVPEWPEKPIPPGQEGEIKVKFNTTNRPGNQRKPITITANTYPKMTKIYLKGYVESEEDGTANE